MCVGRKNLEGKGQGGASLSWFSNQEFPRALMTGLKSSQIILNHDLLCIVGIKITARIRKWMGKRFEKNV